MNLQIKLILSVSVPHFFAQSQAQLKLTVFITDKHLLNFIIDDTYLQLQLMKKLRESILEDRYGMIVLIFLD